MNGIAEEIDRQFKVVCTDRSIIFTVKADKITVIGDKVRLRQVILILLDNALGHTPEGGEIKLTIENQEKLAEISVADNGEGIPLTHLPHVFERFYQAKSDRRNSSGGSGLGLSIAKSIIEAHGGKISIQSEAGKGTKVLCLLPKTNAII